MVISDQCDLPNQGTCKCNEISRIVDDRGEFYNHQLSMSFANLAWLGNHQARSENQRADEDALSQTSHYIFLFLPGLVKRTHL